MLGTRVTILPLRRFSKYIDKDRTSKAIRQKFLDYFVNENGHNLVRSSPVVPFCDPTVAFVNAGMNQFKGVFMGKQEPQFKKVANSQKCVRVGGRHNDLEVVGTDGYHHTFFEMLGNWSFGDYFKREACEMAWKLLTKEYKIPPSRLYFTYFQGDPKLGIEEDLETKEIWKSLGIPEDRILPFSSKDNFWEMGVTGPCGPCTEIHIDHVGSSNRANFINKGLHDLTELWNIVFIQYNRTNKESLDLLPQKHVDTGMGFERLTAVLQGKISNYDTDNFTYLLNAIHKNCRQVPEYKGKFGESDWDHLDTSYRTLADHARMITVCLADGIIPERNQKLRRVMRKAFYLSETAFKKDKGLLKELSNYVIEHLGPVYTEMERHVKRIHQIIDYEEEVYRSLRRNASDEWAKITEQNPELADIDATEMPNVVSAYRELQSVNHERIGDELAFKLYDTFGLDENSIAKLALCLHLEFDPDCLERQLDLARTRTRQHFLTSSVIFEKLNKEKVAKTENGAKYDYFKAQDKYVFKNVNVKVLKILENLEIVPEIGPDTYCALLLDRTNFYTESGGQIGDQGAISFDGNIFEVTETQNCDGYILHKGFLHSSKYHKLKPDDGGVLYLDSEFRLKTMRNHTAAHLLNATLGRIKPTCQKSSKITDSYLNLDVGIFDAKISLDEVTKIEQSINDLIKSALPVTVSEINSQQLTGLDDVTMIPGEIYPDDGIRLVEVKNGDGFLSREPCCGTHVFDTSDIKDFCIIGLKSLGRSTASIHAVTGDRAKIAKANGMEIVDNIESFEKELKDNLDKPELLNLAVSGLKQSLNYSFESSSILPFVVKQQCADSLNRISKKIKDSEKNNLKELMEIEMRNVLDSNLSKTSNDQAYLVHYLRSSMVLDSVPLQKATRLCPDIPVIVISYSESTVKARCCVPKDLVKNGFSAESWLKDTVATVFKSNAAPPKGQDGRSICNMKAKKVNIQDWDGLLKESIEAAQKYIEEKL